MSAWLRCAPAPRRSKIFSFAWSEASAARKRWTGYERPDPGDLVGAVARDVEYILARAKAGKRVRSGVRGRVVRSMAGARGHGVPAAFETRRTRSGGGSGGAGSAADFSVLAACSAADGRYRGGAGHAQGDRLPHSPGATVLDRGSPAGNGQLRNAVDCGRGGSERAIQSASAAVGRIGRHPLHRLQPSRSEERRVGK